MYSTSPSICKCIIRYCTNIALFSVDSRPYCIEHANINVLTPMRYEYKSLKLCANGKCENRGRIRHGDQLYCTDYFIVQYYNSHENTSRYSECSDVKYITCMYEDCWSVPSHLLSEGIFRGYYCNRHHDILRDEISNSQYIPSSDDWIEYALENVALPTDMECI